MRKFFGVIVFFICSITALFAQQNLTWSMALQKGSESVAFSRPVAMTNGDSFSLSIQANQACFAYLIYIDPQGQMDIILNQRLAANEIWRDTYELLQPSGRETIHVVMSLTEQPELQDAINSLNNNDARTARDLNNAVAGTRRSASQFSENPEKPVGMGGAVRGNEITGGTEFSGAGIYVKTIVIDH